MSVYRGTYTAPDIRFILVISSLDIVSPLQGPLALAEDIEVSQVQTKGQCFQGTASLLISFTCNLLKSSLRCQLGSLYSKSARNPKPRSWLFPCGR